MIKEESCIDKLLSDLEPILTVQKISDIAAECKLKYKDVVKRLAMCRQNRTEIQNCLLELKPIQEGLVA